ncbi:hypoxanthine/guanine phosphoribosyltransferase [Halomarina litorea]|uniref:hypoxanthine/guanine phosphoribosyltransferase n=1 Tax=Halomarina litorea TaxID=2961595 RepID=UPI0020C31049|nr:hypoxanthine/guanine phosphoribosyltransferase [Halomarina sp. BCD28]
MPDLTRLKASLRSAPVVDRDGYDYMVHPVTDGIPRVEPDLLREVARALATVADLEGVDYLVTPEAMGIHHATALSLETDLPFVVVRKRSYGLDGEVAVHQTTGYGEDELYLNGVEAGDRVCVVDDMLSTGGTLAAVCTALGEAGAEVVDVVTVLRRDDGIPDLPVDPSSLLRVEVVDGEVRIEE